MKSRLLHALLAILGIAVFVTIAIVLENETGVPFATTYRVACAGACLFFIAKIGSDYPGETWPKIVIVVAFLINALIFFTPLVARPASRGEIMLFALPDAIVFLAIRTIYYRATDNHTRAVRQQLILSLILAFAFLAIILFLVSLGPYQHAR